jgi:hypothetical protein
MSMLESTVVQEKATGSNKNMKTNGTARRPLTRSQTRDHREPNNVEDNAVQPLSRNGSIIKEADNRVSQYIPEQNGKITMYLLRAFIWILGVMVRAIFVVRVVLIFFLYRTLSVEYDANTLLRGTIECAQGRDEKSCSELTNGLFPPSITKYSYQATFKLTDPNDVSEKPLINITIPIVLRNPIYIFLSILAAFATEYFLSYMQYFLATTTYCKCKNSNKTVSKEWFYRLITPNTYNS